MLKALFPYCKACHVSVIYTCKINFAACAYSYQIASQAIPKKKLKAATNAS